MRRWRLPRYLLLQKLTFMGFPAARLIDLHLCPMVTGLVPHIGGPIIGPGCPTVLIQGLPAGHATDVLACIGPPDIIAKGSSGVFIGGFPAARMLDRCAHGGLIVLGCFTVLIGETGNGAGGPDAPMPAAQALAGSASGRSTTVQIDGDNAFKAQTMIALAMIALARTPATPSGREWHRQMQANGRTVAIHKGAPEQNDCTPRNGANAANGTGSDINRDPGTTDCGNDTILFHEMVHSMHNANGDKTVTVRGRNFPARGEQVSAAKSGARGALAQMCCNPEAPPALSNRLDRRRAMLQRPSRRITMARVSIRTTRPKTPTGATRAFLNALFTIRPVGRVGRRGDSTRVDTWMTSFPP